MNIKQKERERENGERKDREIEKNGEEEKRRKEKITDGDWERDKRQ